ncbi:MAG: hypothetical protein MUO89_04615 [Dehalococcoidia bacterium]|nr:hypothetical protein [Dehalococcoidia bacterium]
MERRLGRDPFAQSGLDKIFTPVVEQATTVTSKPTIVKAKPRIKASGRVSIPPVSVISTSTSSKGLPKGWTRATFIVRQDLVRKVKRAAYWDRKQIKDLVSEALDAYLVDKKTD